MHTQHQAQKLFLAGPAGKLEAVLWTPAGVPPNMAALVCHPHPLFGGTLHNKVVYQAAKGLDTLGLAVLRFNFRGAGLSEGRHDRGVGEVGDVHCALDFLGEQFPRTPLLLAGFSFGCWVGLRAGCSDPRVMRLIGLGAPVNSSDFSYLLQCVKPKLFVQGENDEFGSIAKLRELVGTLIGENQLIVVPGVDHFFAGKIESVGKAITEWLRPALAKEVPSR
jgi:alpha/beta superfamily hydrolase